MAKLNNPPKGNYTLYAIANGNGSAMTIVDGGINLRSKIKGESVVKKLRSVFINANQKENIFSFKVR